MWGVDVLAWLEVPLPLVITSSLCQTTKVVLVGEGRWEKALVGTPSGSGKCVIRFPCSVMEFVANLVLIH